MPTTPDLNRLSQTDSPLGSPLTHTLADVLAATEADQRLPDARRKEMAGAIRTLCTVLDIPASAVPGEMTEIDRLLAAVPFPARGRSRKTVANTRSRVKAAVLHATSAPKRPPRGEALTPEWAALYEKLTDMRLRNGLSRLVRTASFDGIAPDQVTDAVMDRLVAKVRQVNWGRDALPFWRRSVTLWNDAVVTVPGWPSTPLTPPQGATRVAHLSLAAFPESFQGDVKKYLDWASGADRFANDARVTALKPGTLRLLGEHLRGAASVLAKKLGDVAEIKNVAILVEPANARTILQAFIDDRPDGKATTYIRSLATTLIAVAHEWVHVSDQVLSELKALRRVLGATPTGLTAKNRNVIRQLEDGPLLAQLLSLPDDLFAQARKARLSPARRLHKVRIGLAIALLLRAPMRMQNLAGLQLGRQVQWPTGRAGDPVIVLLEEETKNAEPMEYPITGHGKDLLIEYLDRYRIHADRDRSPWLFLQGDGTPVSAEALRDGITKAIRRALGIEVTPHQFRHLAAAIILKEQPGAVGLVKDLLGHRNIKTTLNFYAGMRTKDAAREWDRILANTTRTTVPTAA